jgi:phage terminase small subunit
LIQKTSEYYVNLVITNATAKRVVGLKYPRRMKVASPKVQNGVMTMDKKTSRSQKGEMDTLKGAMQKLAIPRHIKLDEIEEEIYHLYVQKRAQRDWFEADLISVAQLAQLTHSLIIHTDMLKEEGAVIFNAKGTPVANPLFAVTDAILRQQLSIIRLLGFAGSAAGGDKRNTENRAAKEKDTRDKLGKAKPDKANLLAVPPTT